MLRSPGYSGHPIGERPIMLQDRYSPRIDQGERLFTFWFDCGESGKCLEQIDRQALALNEKPFVLSFYPAGEGRLVHAAVILEGGFIQMSAFKKAENSDDYIVRLFEPNGSDCVTRIFFPFIGLEEQITFTGFEIKTFRLEIKNRRLVETDLMEKDVC